MRALIIGIACYARTELKNVLSVRKGIALALLLSVMSSVFGATVSRLYTITLPVLNQSEQIRTQTFQEGLSQMLVRASGKSQAAQIIAPEPPANYVAQFTYDNVATPQGQQLVLTMQFDSNAVRQLLTKNNLPLWGSNRPSTVVWITVTTVQGSMLLTSDNSTDALINAVKQIAEQRGLPLVWPLLDLNDMQSVTASDVLQNNIPVVQAASQRYSSDAMLLISIDETRLPSVTSQWTLVFQGKQSQWVLSANSIEQAVQIGMNDVSGTMAQSFAVKTNKAESQVIHLQINGIETPAQFSAVQRYLAGITGVRAVVPTSVNGDVLGVQLTIDAPLQSVLGQIQVSHHFQASSEYNEQALVYQYED